MTVATYSGDALDSVVKQLSQGGNVALIHKRLTTKHNVTSEDADAIIAEAETKIAADQRREIKETLSRKRRELRANDEGIDADVVASLEAKIRGRLEPDDLAGFNDDLAKKGRRLTYTEIAIVAAIHGRSVRENDGQSPFHRIAKLAAKSGLTEASLDNRQIRYALTILEAIQYTSQVDAAIRGTVTDGKYKQGKCGVWRMVDQRYWNQ